MQGSIQRCPQGSHAIARSARLSATRPIRRFPPRQMVALAPKPWNSKSFVASATPEEGDGKSTGGRTGGGGGGDLDAEFDLDALIDVTPQPEAINVGGFGRKQDLEQEWDDEDDDDVEAPLGDPEELFGDIDDEEASAQPVYPPRPVRVRQLPELLRAAGYAEAAASAPDLEILDIITCNSDTAVEGALYVCVPSEDGSSDGHDWVDEAAELGAVAIVSSRPIPDCLVPVILVNDTLKALGTLAAEFYDHPSRKMQTVAFVGSYGKTTTAWFLRGMLEVGTQEEVVCMVGDSEYSISADKLTREGDIWELPMDPENPTKPLDATLDRRASTPFHLTPYEGKYELPETTPDALHLQKVLAGGADRGAGAALVEVCPSLCADGRAAELHAEVLVFTNVSADVAAADPGGEDAYVERISGFFDGLTDRQTAVINMDDRDGPLLARMVADSPAQLITFSISSKDADVYIERHRPTIWETDVIIRTPLGRLNIIFSLVGRHNLSNVLAAVSAGLALGIPLVDIVRGIEEVSIVPGRCEIVDEGQQFAMIVDAARTPEQLAHVIDGVKEAGARRTILVLGCPGDTTPEERAQIGAAADYRADIVIFANDSPGRVPPDQIIADMVSGMSDKVIGNHAGAYLPWMQDKSRVPQWYEPWLLRYQSEVGRYVIEDRRTAIRVAVGLAKPRDVVLVAGRGDVDYIDMWDGLTPLPGWGQRGEDEAAGGDQEDQPTQSLEDAFSMMGGRGGGAEPEGGAWATTRRSANEPKEGAEKSGAFDPGPTTTAVYAEDEDGEGDEGWWEMQVTDPETGETWRLLEGDRWDLDESGEKMVWHRAEEGEPMRLTGTLRAWFDDRVEARDAVAELERLEARKDLDRSTLPWTRYPEERERYATPSMRSAGMDMMRSGQGLDQYMRMVAEQEGEEEEEEEEEEYDEEDEEYEEVEGGGGGSR